MNHIELKFILKQFFWFLYSSYTLLNQIFCPLFSRIYDILTSEFLHQKAYAIIWLPITLSFIVKTSIFRKFDATIHRLKIQNRSFFSNKQKVINGDKTFPKNVITKEKKKRGNKWFHFVENLPSWYIPENKSFKREIVMAMHNHL